jgi:hypothetical protein
MLQTLPTQVRYGSHWIVTGLPTRFLDKGWRIFACGVSRLGALTAVAALFLTGCTTRQQHVASPASSSAAASVPLLGRKWGPDQEGYGEPHPKTIFNGGDPTGLVTNVRWQSWGGPKAIGDGTALYAPESVVNGHKAPARVVAFDLGMCNGIPAYRAIEWYFPQYSESFKPGTYIDICTGKYVG